MSELPSFVWMAYVVPPLRTVVAAVRTHTSGAPSRVLHNARALALVLERRLMDPGPPRTWVDTGT